MERSHESRSLASAAVSLMAGCILPHGNTGAVSIQRMGHLGHSARPPSSESKVQYIHSHCFLRSPARRLSTRSAQEVGSRGVADPRLCVEELEEKRVAIRVIRQKREAKCVRVCVRGGKFYLHLSTSAARNADGKARGWVSASSLPLSVNPKSTPQRTLRSRL